MKPLFTLALTLTLTAWAGDGGASPADSGTPVTPRPAAEPKPAAAPKSAPDAGTTAAAPAPKPPKPIIGGTHCKMVRASDNQVLSDHVSAGSILDCQQEARTEVRTRFCKESRERITVLFTGDWNGTPIDGITMHVVCPKKDAPK